MGIASYLCYPLSQPRAQISSDNWASAKPFWRLFFLATGAPWILDNSTATDAGKDSEIAYLLFAYTNPESQYLLTDKTTAGDIWAALKAEFEQGTLATRFAARMAFNSVEHDISLPVGRYVASVKAAAQRVKDLGEPLSDENVRDQILMGLHPTFATVRQSILSSKDTPNLSTTIGLIQGVGSSAPDLIPKQEPQELSIASAARTSRFSRSPRYPGSSTASTYRWLSPMSDGDCGRCGLSGHRSETCFIPMPEHVRDAIVAGTLRYQSPPTREVGHAGAAVEVEEVEQPWTLERFDEAAEEARRKGLIHI